MISDGILELFCGTHVVVTGGTGLIGRQVVDLLAGAGAHVKVVSLDSIQVNEQAEHQIVDLREFAACKECIKGADFVFHLAGIKASATVSSTCLSTHFVPSLMMNTNVLEACRVQNVSKVVFTSSIGAYASTNVFREEDYKLDSLPMDFAGWTKRVAELQIQSYRDQYGLDYAIVRPSNVYGPGDNFDPDNAMVIPSLLYRIWKKEDPLLVWGDGSAIRDFAYSRDVAEGIILALYHCPPGFVNLGSGTGVSIKELVEIMSKIIGFSYEFDTSKSSGFPTRVMDISLARKLLGYHPSTSLESGLRETYSWFLENSEEFLYRKNYFRGVNE